MTLVNLVANSDRVLHLKYVEDLQEFRDLYPYNVTLTNPSGNCVSNESRSRHKYHESLQSILGNV